MTTPLRVLIVEDEATDAKLMALELKRSGFAPNAVRVETEAEMTAALDAEPWDLVLADHRLPHFSGTRALELVRERKLDVPFILVSGTVGEENAVAAMKAGAHDFVLKGALRRLGPAARRELHEAEQRRQRRRAERSLKLMADLGRLMTDAPDYRAVLKGAVNLAVPAMADCSVLYLATNHSVEDVIETACIPGVDPRAIEALAQSYRRQSSRDEDDPVARALHTQEPVLVSAQAGDGGRDAAAGTPLAAAFSFGLCAVIAVPLLVRSDLVGLWVFGATRADRYTSADVELVRELGGRIALVAENARLARAREEFVAAAVHEIKTPVAVIKLAVQHLQRTAPEQRGAQLPRFLARLERQTDRLTRLVTDVLEVFRIEIQTLTLTRRPTSVAALLSRIAEEMSGVSSRHEIVIGRNEAVIADIDPDRIEQVVTNLIDNAIKYSPGGGRVELESRMKGEQVVISVRDQGIGIPAERQSRIFERFYRAHAGTPYDHSTSLGVGLFLSRRFVVDHGGEMWFESKDGEGTTFHFSVPIAAAAEEAQRSDDDAVRAGL